jgi:hypothetical protein
MSFLLLDLRFISQKKKTDLPHDPHFSSDFPSFILNGIGLSLIDFSHHSTINCTKAKPKLGNNIEILM